MRHEPTLPAALTTSIDLRMPVFEAGTAPTTKIAALEEYLLLTAYYQGDLAKERLEWQVKLVPIRDAWDHLTGWEHLKLTSRSEKAVASSKRQVRPDLYDRLMDHDWMIARLTEEIDRMERDATKASRAYTLMTGG